MEFERLCFHRLLTQARLGDVTPLLQIEGQERLMEEHVPAALIAVLCGYGRLWKVGQEDQQRREKRERPTFVCDTVRRYLESLS